MSFLLITVSAVISVAVTSVVLVAFVHLQISNEAKILIVAGGLASATLLAQLAKIKSSLSRIEDFQRLNFIATEYLRRHPDDETPATQIAMSDIKEEVELDRAKKEIAGTQWAGAVVWIVWAVMVLVVTGFLDSIWTILWQ